MSVNTGPSPRGRHKYFAAFRDVRHERRWNTFVKTAFCVQKGKRGGLSMFWPSPFGRIWSNLVAFGRFLSFLVARPCNCNAAHPLYCLFGWYLVGFWLISTGFWLASVKSDNSGFKPENGGLWRFTVVYGGLRRFIRSNLVAFKHVLVGFWSLLVASHRAGSGVSRGVSRVYQRCIKWQDCHRQWPFGFIENLLRFY